MDNSSQQLHRDLETGLVNEPYSPNRQDNAELLVNHPYDDNETNAYEHRSYFDYSLPYNILAFSVPIAKICATIFFLIIENYSCLGAKQFWLLGMMLHDILHAKIISMKIRIILATRSLGSSDANNTATTGNNGQYQASQEIQMGVIQPRQTAQQESRENSETDVQVPIRIAPRVPQGMSMAEILALKNDVVRLSTTLTYYWMFLFIFWIEMDSLRLKGSCDTERIDALVSFYVFLAWLYLLNPMIICFMGCLCVPVLLIVFFIFGRPTQVPSSNTEILNLPVTKYSMELPGNKECAICMCDYQEQDNIIQLECSTMHHFHEDCIKNWLKVNGQCPICRARVGKSANAEPPTATSL